MRLDITLCNRSSSPASVRSLPDEQDIAGLLAESEEMLTVSFFVTHHLEFALDQPPVALINPDVTRDEEIVTAFNEAGINAAVFRSPEEFFQKPLLPPPPCVIIEGAALPLDGPHLQMQFLLRGLRVPLILIVEEAQAELALSFMRAGAFDVLIKPVDG